MSLPFAAVITAAGLSQRYGSGIKKEFENLNGHSVLFNAVRPFLKIKNLICIVITYRENMFEQTKASIAELEAGSDVPFVYVKGGATRQQSVKNALEAIEEKYPNAELVAIHDGARPFVKKELIETTLYYASLFGGSAPALAVRDTVAKLSDEGMIESSVPRDGLYCVQTPQTFRFKDILASHRKAEELFTDDVQLFRAAGFYAAAVEGDPANVKITFFNDLEHEDSLNEEECTGNCGSCVFSCKKGEEQ